MIINDEAQIDSTSSNGPVQTKIKPSDGTDPG